MKEKDLTTRAIYLLWLMLSAEQFLNASKYSSAQPPEDEAKQCPWSS